MPVQWVRRTDPHGIKQITVGPPHGIKQITMFIRENVECLDSSFTTTTTIKWTETADTWGFIRIVADKRSEKSMGHSDICGHLRKRERHPEGGVSRTQPSEPGAATTEQVRSQTTSHTHVPVYVLI
ncbi:hypothetical protein J6590_036191 [Homalodisca vitripennis]|nr:hypothetical protein J6590_036191 [Homalodisca vitripennis]